MDPRVASNQTGPWTNEKHLHFLNSMEAAFVRTMLENNGRLLRLDRYLPDSAESTLDLKSQSQRRKKHTTSGIVGPTPRTRVADRSDKRPRRLSSQSHDPSQDQVVPQIENSAGDKGESDPPNAAVAPAN
ncbi:hypothetical protein P3X46_030597 [Hevea brasiliensis]|uniref:Uncharacterized protein n=2 Tax=Hevea brasiliensis TaxID=3981 RepID=A0ABQ9KKU5_HEVBR|nr:uncharacterized protein LOC110641481 isoform X2 [Hevea brasiliensis]KAF2320340.1 hypothetical protein GH714_027189 [Hevea brasiliensis]KAJ9139905.1 hypothetical protein P3X46_030597 [Hevea brasiliensis]